MKYPSWMTGPIYGQRPMTELEWIRYEGEQQRRSALLWFMSTLPDEGRVAMRHRLIEGRGKALERIFNR